MKFHLLILLLLLNFISLSQELEKQYPYIQFIGDVTELDNGDIVFLGRYQIDYKTGSVLFKINAKGDSLFATDIPIYELGTFIQTADGGFAIGGSAINTSPIFFRLDASGNMLWYKDYGGYGQITKVIEKPNGGFLLLTNKALMNIDESGNQIWYKDLTKGQEYYCADIKKMHDGDYILAGHNHQKSDIYYAKINLSGIFLWEKEFSSMPGKTYSVFTTSDRGFVLTGNYGGNSGMIKCDSLGNVEIYKKYMPTFISEFNCGIETSDYGYAFSGVLYENHIPQMYLVKTDNLGNIQWTKKNSDTISIYDNYLFKVVETKDKKYFLVAGYNNNISYLSKWIYKEDLKPDPKPNETIPYIILYPNPFFSVANVVVTNANTPIDFAIYDAIGQKCKEIKGITTSNFQINRNGLGEGIYFYECYSGSQLIGKGKIMVVN